MRTPFKPRFLQHFLPARTRQPTGNSTGPKSMSRIASGGTGCRWRCRRTAAPPGAAPDDLIEHGPLVGAEVDHAVGDDGVGPAVLDGQPLASPSRNSTCRVRERAGCRRDLASISAVMSTPTTCPSARPGRRRRRCRTRRPNRRRRPARPVSGAGRTGWPTPAKDSTAVGQGATTPRRSRAARRGGRPVWKWKSPWGSVATSRYLFRT